MFPSLKSRAPFALWNNRSRAVRLIETRFCGEKMYTTTQNLLRFRIQKLFFCLAHCTYCRIIVHCFTITDTDAFFPSFCIFFLIFNRLAVSATFLQRSVSAIGDTRFNKFSRDYCVNGTFRFCFLSFELKQILRNAFLIVSRVRYMSVWLSFLPSFLLSVPYILE